ncbi:MAG: carbohydrate ABC transporter permease [Marvinbryantia sp.]|jgi:ABC-type glycerol-3-phosphate transport system permease component
MKKKKILTAYMIIYIFLFALAIVVVFPIIYILLSSFKSNQEILVGGVDLLPKEWKLDNYSQAWTMANFGTLTFNSIFYAFFCVIGGVISAVTAGYVFARGKTKITKFINGMVLCSMFISIGTLSLYPQLNLAKSMGLSGTLWGPIIIHVFGMSATQVFIATGFIRQISPEIDEAARIDGCGFFKIFVKIIFPLCKPLIATSGLMAFRTAWSDYLLPYVFTISEKSKWPLVVGVVSLKSNGEAVSSWNLMLAGISISILPMLIVYLFLNRYFIDGLTEGAVKG